MNNCTPKLLVLFFALILTSCSSNGIEIIGNDSNIPIIESEKPIESEILNLINNYRIDNGFSSLNKSQIIKTQTSNHTNYMIEKNEVSHDYFFKRKEYLSEKANAVQVGENVAYGYSNAESVVKAWIKSEGHKKNIEGNYTHFDITAEKNADGKWYFTNIFVKQ